MDVWQIYTGGEGAGILHEKVAEKEGEGSWCCLNFCCLNIFWSLIWRSLFVNLIPNFYRLES